MTLVARVGATRAGFTLDCDLLAADSATIALLGPNGAGKTTLLNVLCGLLPASRGRVELGGEVLEDVGAGIRRPPEARGIGVVFQDLALFPHLSALDNVAFGLRCRGADRRRARREAGAWLERTGFHDQFERRPAALSGGERQKVALARALAAAPRLLLLDEPLAAVDAAARAELRRSLRGHLESFAGPRLLVTHDPVEAAALASGVVILEEGRVTQRGTFAEVSARPRSAWVARVAGVNLIRGRAAAGVLETDGGERLAIATAASGDVLATIHPRAVALYREAPWGSPRNLVAGLAGEIDPQGDRWRIRFDGRLSLVAEVTPAAAADLHLSEGGPLVAAIKATEIDVYPA